MEIKDTSDYEGMSVSELNAYVNKLNAVMSMNQTELDKLKVIKSNKEHSIINQNIKETTMFEKDNPDKDIVVLHDGTFIIVERAELLSEPENYDFSYDFKGKNIKAVSKDLGFFGRTVFIIETTESGKYQSAVNDYVFDTPAAERALSIKI